MAVLHIAKLKVTPGNKDHHLVCEERDINNTFIISGFDEVEQIMSKQKIAHMIKSEGLLEAIDRKLMTAKDSPGVINQHIYIIKFLSDTPGTFHN